MSASGPSAFDSDLREGEALEIAIADAEKKARAARQQANESIAQAEKWEGVATQLRAARELSRLPASPKPPTSAISRRLANAEDVPAPVTASA
jgi:hypothetical protein